MLTNDQLGKWDRESFFHPGSSGDPNMRDHPPTSDG